MPRGRTAIREIFLVDRPLTDAECAAAGGEGAGRGAANELAARMPYCRRSIRGSPHDSRPPT